MYTDDTVIHHEMSPSDTPSPKRKSSFAFASLPAREPLKPKASLTSATAEIIRSNEAAATSRGKLVRPAKITVRVQSQLPPQQTPMSEESSVVGGISDWSCSVHGSNGVVYPPARAPGNPRVKALEAAAKKKEDDEHAEKMREQRKKETERKRAEEQAEMARKRAEEQAEMAKKRAEEQAEAKKRAEEQAEIARKRAEEQAEARRRAEEQAELAAVIRAEEQAEIAKKRYEEHKEAEHKRMEQWRKQAESVLGHPEVDAAKKRADARKKELDAKRALDRKEAEERRVAREARRAEDKLKVARLQEERKALERARAAK